MIYLDNAATSFPKPIEVIEAASRFMREIGANPGRSGHRLSVAAARVLFEARRELANLLGVKHPERVIFTKNATEALNVVINGLLSEKEGNVVVTSMEHNAVMRPLRRIASRRLVEIRVFKANPDGSFEVKKFKEIVDEKTIAVFLNHASNVTGTVCPIFEILEITEKRGIPCVLDLTQSLGNYPMSFAGFDFAVPVFTGHKSLLGFPGTGGFYLPEGIDFEPLILGGTGSRSEEEIQPDFLPDKFESGTPNTPGIASLLEGVRWIKKRGVENIRKHEIRLAKAFAEELEGHPKIKLYGHKRWSERIAVVSLAVRGKDPAVVSYILDKEFGIMTRAGLHCAPSAHRTLGTFPKGTVRFAFGPFNSEKDVEEATKAIKKVAEG